MQAYLLDIGNMLLRWLHVIAAIAWIGESFYFVMHDASLREPENPEDRKPGVAGELWMVHGGGFYHNVKYATAPARLPKHLHWEFLKAYTTWLSGFALLILVYLVHPDLTLIDHASPWAWVRGMSALEVDALAVAFLIGGWVVYNELCKRISPTMQRDGVLSIAVALMVVLLAWLTTTIFPGRAAFLLTGAVMATCMAANVAMWIIPGQRRMVAAIKAGEAPDPLDGKRGKQRSVHNTYFTLPVVFLMLSNHYPALFGGAHAAWIMVLMIFAGALIRQFFVELHAGKTRPLYPVIGVGLIFAVIALAMPRAPAKSATGAQPRAATPLVRVAAIIDARCVACHAAHPTQPGFAAPPKGIDLENLATVTAMQAKIKQVVATKFMPLGNLTHMTDAERAAIAAWSSPPK